MKQFLLYFNFESHDFLNKQKTALSRLYRYSARFHAHRRPLHSPGQGGRPRLPGTENCRQHCARFCAGPRDRVGHSDRGRAQAASQRLDGFVGRH